MPPLALNARVHSGPNCWTDRTTGAIYHTHYDSTREGYITKTVPGGAVTTTKLSTLSGNPLAMPASADNHLALTVGMDSDGYVYVAGNMHGHLMRCIRFDTPRSVSGAFTNMAATLTVDTGEVCTYPNFVSFSDGSLGLWIRRRVADASNNIGKWGLWLKAPSQAWAYQGTVLQDMPHDTTAVSGAEDVGDFLAYTGPPTVTADDVLRIATAWDDWGTDNSRADIGYMESADKGATWRNVTGTSITLPLEYAGRAVQTVGQNPGNGFNDGHSVTVDSNGRPAILTSDLFTTHNLIRWNGSAWATTAVSTPTFTSRSRLVNWRGELWTIGTASGAVQLRNVENPTTTFTLGIEVATGHEAPVDPEALRDHLIRTAFLTGNETPQTHTFGAIAAVRAA